ncbi:hypothetical protein SUGI_0459560 [Cryptomeria japonica]|nr:hypothetical protein SUGI_0459560 [Cryptomeria japonica]
MDCRVLVLSVICVCMVGFTSAAECVPEKCGNWEVSYPFYINNSDCGYHGFQINCTMDNSTGKMALFLPADIAVRDGDGTSTAYFKIMETNHSGYIVIDSSSLKASSCQQEADAFKRFHLPGPFYFSMSDKFVVAGCNTTGNYTYGDRRGEARCISSCYPQIDPPYCRYGCCEITVPDNNWKITFTSEGEGDGICGFSTIMDPSTFRVADNKTDLSWGDVQKAYYGLRLNWGIGDMNCSMAEGTEDYSCSTNAKCLASPSRNGHVCGCLPGYKGSGYFNGTRCIDIDECSSEGVNMCVGVEDGGKCTNLEGFYSCSCAKGYIGDGFRNGTRCVSKISNDLRTAIIGSISSFVGVSVVASGLLWWRRIRRLENARLKNFEENGGKELENLLDSMGGKKSLKLFSERELETASKNYSMIIGNGGFATVYKGVLEDLTPIAIKTPKSISKEEFKNEIAILSHISHRNVVKLFGCCLQTKPPSVVYEFVPNGTVFEHLHSKEKELSWETRRQIAIETAEAIAYIHDQASQRIFHRDIKSSNILLDNTFTPKVADFGISRLRPSADGQLSTRHCSGTPGYMDPDFKTSNKFTDKSDVFSFGVVLVELLTGLRPLLSTGNLYDYFLSKINDKCLTEILDVKVKNRENQGQMESMASLAQECLRKEAKSRPSMRDVVDKLYWIRFATKESSDLNQAGLNCDTSPSTSDNFNSVPNCPTAASDCPSSIRISSKQSRLAEHTNNPTCYHSLTTYPDCPTTSSNCPTTSSDCPTTPFLQIEMSDKHAR